LLYSNANLWFKLYDLLVNKYRYLNSLKIGQTELKSQCQTLFKELHFFLTFKKFGFDPDPEADPELPAMSDLDPDPDPKKNLLGSINRNVSIRIPNTLGSVFDNFGSNSPFFYPICEYRYLFKDLM